MKLTLKLRYGTAFGQSLLITGNHPQFGGGDPARAVPLEYLNSDFWQVTIPFAGDPVTEPLRYNYILRQPDGSTVMDWGRDHVLSPELFQNERVVVVDSWNAAARPDNVFYTEPFQSVLLRGNHADVTGHSAARFTHTFRVKTPLLKRGQTLALLGNTEALGRWNTARPLLLQRSSGSNHLSVSVDLRDATFPIEYKYGVFDAGRGEFVAYEGGGNRTLGEMPDAGLVLVDDGFADLPGCTWRGAGVAIPVFSLRSDRSFGIGEFADLKPLADWCAHVGLKLIQILPVNDTTSTHTWTDSYPYSAISAFALNPVYLNLDAVVAAKNSAALKQLAAERQRLNALVEMDYEAVAKAKLAFLKQIFPAQKTATLRSKDYKAFHTENEHWLVPYTVFCCLRDKFGTADSRLWPAHQRCTPETIASVTAPGSPDLEGVEFNYFLQFHLHRQLQDAAAHAHARGVILKGDIAIGVSRNGADTWQSPELYDLSVQAGAPPDPFAEKGQNWGFPTYNWPRMQQDGFAWWKQRFAQMGHYFDAFRIDHILGFFRIWTIPADAVEGILGHFAPAIPVELDEFTARGIGFNRARFVEPFINDHVLDETFGADAGVVKQTFLRSSAPGQYALRPEFATQRQVDEYFNLLQRTGVPVPSQEGGPSILPLPAGEGRGEGERAEFKATSDFTTCSQPGSTCPLSLTLDPSPAGRGKQQSSALPRPAVAGHPAVAGDRAERIKLGLFDLISNVLLFEVEGSRGRQFHFRFHIEKTASFRALDPQTQAQFRDLYVDYFFRRQDEFWRKQALQKLPALKRVTNMLICGEDLGLVPACVPDVMRDLGLLSLEIQRMPKTPDRTFSRPAEAPYLSVVTPSTHDMSTIRGWWQEDAQLTQRFYNNELGLPGAAPAECSGALNESVVCQHLASPAMWSIFQLQDLLGMDESLRRGDANAERINIPANPKHYWRYRMHHSLESLLGQADFNQRLGGLLQQSGRS